MLDEIRMTIDDNGGIEMAEIKFEGCCATNKEHMGSNAAEMVRRPATRIFTGGSNG